MTQITKTLNHTMRSPHSMALWLDKIKRAEGGATVTYDLDNKQVHYTGAKSQVRSALIAHFWYNKSGRNKYAGRGDAAQLADMVMRGETL
jgi:hypothetical protein